MSVPSSKSMVTSVRPYLDTERRMRWRGMPSSSCSIGTAMRVSTSSGVMPGAFMMIFTCVVDTSGKASMGRPMKAYTPPATRTAVATSISSRCVSEKPISLASIVSFALVDAHPGSLEGGHALYGDALVALERGGDQRRLSRLPRPFDRERPKALRHAHEHIDSVALVHQRRLR